MESKKRKAYFRNSTSTSLLGDYPYAQNIYEDPAVYKYFKSQRLQLQACPLINTSAAFNSSFLRRAAFINPTMKPLLTPEDLAEIERRKKLRDTASKILRKIKTTSVNKDSNGVNPSDGSNMKDKTDLTNGEPVFDRNQSGCAKKPKRIAHSSNKSKLCSVKKIVTKTVKASGKKNLVSGNYEVNKAAVKDFQNRIQHKLINEIMQMPRENLQNMLNDPKINPLMQVKISHLVKENRHLIAQKLRAMAESKMNSKDAQGSSQFLADIDKLIDPVIETDLSVLPYDLIKQMENIFQVQFDYSNKISLLQNMGHCELLTKPQQENNGIITMETSDDSNSVEMLTPECWKESVTNSSQKCHILDMDPPKMSKPEEPTNVEQPPSSSNYETSENCTSTNSDDLLYQCSTDEDEEEPECNRMAEGFDSKAQHASTFVNSLKVEFPQETNNANDQGGHYQQIKKDITTESYDGGGQDHTDSNHSNHVAEPEMKYSSVPTEMGCNECMSKNETTIKYSADEVEDFEVDKVPIFTPEYSHKSVGSQTERRFVSTSTQTTKPIHDTGCLYGVPVPKKATEELPTSLLQEVNEIQGLMNQLNHRRFMIFLKLAEIYPHGEFVADPFGQSSFIESVTGGNDFLVNRLKEFFCSGVNRSSRTRLPKLSKHKNRRKRKRDQKKDTPQLKEVNP